MNIPHTVTGCRSRQIPLRSIFPTWGVARDGYTARRVCMSLYLWSSRVPYCPSLVSVRSDQVWVLRGSRLESRHPYRPLENSTYSCAGLLPWLPFTLRYFCLGYS